MLHSEQENYALEVLESGAWREQAANNGLWIDLLRFDCLRSAFHAAIQNNTPTRIVVVEDDRETRYGTPVLTLFPVTNG